MPRAKGGSIPPPTVHIQPGHGGLVSSLNDNDVLSGRGGRINNHAGNIAFRTLVEEYKHEYLDPRTRKLEKAHVAARLVAQVRAMNPPGRFLKEDGDHPGLYLEIGDEKAWKKAGQALREDAPEIRKGIDEEIQVDQHSPHPVLNVAQGVSAYRQPPLPYYGNHPLHPSGRGPPHYHSQAFAGRAFHPQHQHPPQNLHVHPQYPPHQGQPYEMHPQQRQPQFISGPRNRFGAPLSTSDRRGDFPSLAMSVGTDFTMSDVSEFTPIGIDVQKVPNSKQTTRPVEVTTSTDFNNNRGGGGGGSKSLAVSDLSTSGTKLSFRLDESITNAPTEPLTTHEEHPRRESTTTLGISASLSFPDFFLGTGDLLGEEPVEDDKNALDPNDGSSNNGGTRQNKIKPGRLFKQLSTHRQSSSDSNSIFSVESLKWARGFHPMRSRNNTDMSGLQDAMSLMSMEYQSFKSEASWLEAAKSMQSISSDTNPWNSLRMTAPGDDGSIRSLLSDMSNDLIALDLAEPPLLPPIQHVESGLEDAGLFQRPDP